MSASDDDGGLIDGFLSNSSIVGDDSDTTTGRPGDRRPTEQEQQRQEDLFGSLGPTAKALLENPVNVVLAIVVGAIVGVWRAFLDFLGELFTWASAIPQRAVFGPVGWALSPVGELIIGLVTLADGAVESLILGFGPFAPVAAPVVWGGVIVVFAIVFNIALGLISTYLPIEAIPGVRRLV